MAANRTNSRKPYTGDRKALVIAFDVGTTFSGVSYAILEPGEVPKTLGVTRYPGQEHVTGNTKIPSLLYYDRSGKLKAAGAEAESSQVEAEAEDEGWVKVELFKLRLRPKTMHLETNGINFSPLPPGKSSEHVFGDFLRYLFICTRRFIEDSHAGGDRLWRHVENNIHVVLSHPNGWEGPQQSRMRRAAIYAGLIPDTDEGKARIRFVTEGEASMHACIHNGLAHDVLQSGNGFIVADAGGGTLDISSYILRGMHPLTLEEVAPPDCIFAGAVFVSRRCRVFLQEKLRNSKYGTPDALDHITKRFDETTKRLFRDKHETQYIHFGSPLDKDLKVGIRNGQLKLTGEEVASFFEPSLEAAISSIRKQMESSKGVVKAVWLVGGFAASPWLFSQMQERLAPLGVTVNRPDTQTSKAVADGAIGFFCDHHVSARMSRYMYGVEYLREINNDDEEHRARQGRLLQLPSGPRFLPDAFDCILAKGVRVKESSVFSRKYYTEVTKLSTLSVFEIEIWCYRGGMEVPQWIDRQSDHFASLCFVRADLSKLSNSAQPKTGPNGLTYWTVVFAIEIHFGLTEFKARMKWNEDGKTRYGPASIVFNEKGVRSDEDDMYSIADDELNTPSATPPSMSRQTSTSTATTSTATSIPSVNTTPSMTSNRTSASTVRQSSLANKTKSRGLAKDAGRTPPPSSFPTASVASSFTPSRTPSAASMSRQPASAPFLTPSATSSIRTERRVTEQPPPPPPPVESAAPSPTDTLLNASTSRKSRPNSRIMTSFGKASPVHEAPPPPPSPRREEPQLPPIVEEVRHVEMPAPPAPVEPAPIEEPAPTIEVVEPEPIRAPTPVSRAPSWAEPPAPVPDYIPAAVDTAQHVAEEFGVPKAPSSFSVHATPKANQEPLLFDDAPLQAQSNTNSWGRRSPSPRRSSVNVHDLLTEQPMEPHRSPARSVRNLPGSPARVAMDILQTPIVQPKSPVTAPIDVPRSPSGSINKRWGNNSNSPSKGFFGAGESWGSRGDPWETHNKTPEDNFNEQMHDFSAPPRSPFKSSADLHDDQMHNDQPHNFAPGSPYRSSAGLQLNEFTAPQGSPIRPSADLLSGEFSMGQQPSPARSNKELPKSPSRSIKELSRSPSNAFAEIPLTSNPEPTPEDAPQLEEAAPAPVEVTPVPAEATEDEWPAANKGKKGKKGKKGGKGKEEPAPAPPPPPPPMEEEIKESLEDELAKLIDESPSNAVDEPTPAADAPADGAEAETPADGDGAAEPPADEQPNPPAEEPESWGGPAAKGKKKKGKKGAKADDNWEQMDKPEETPAAEPEPPTANLADDLDDLLGGDGGEEGADGAPNPDSEQTGNEAGGKKGKGNKKGGDGGGGGAKGKKKKNKK